MNVVEMAVKQPLKLRLDGAEYTLVYPLSAVMWAEEKLGRSLKTPVDWFGAKAKDVPVLLEAGLRAHHPAEAAGIAAVLCGEMGPEDYTEFLEAIGAVAFPRWLARFKTNLEKAKSPKAEGAADR